MEQHQAVKPNINIERKVMIGVIRVVFFMVVFPLIAGLQQWLHQNLSNKHNNNQEINKIIYDFKNNTKTTENYSKQKGFDTRYDRH